MSLIANERSRGNLRDFIRFAVNGRVFDVRGGEAFTTLSDFLRLRLGLTGTKIVCSEGDCGACTVLIGRVRNGRLRYRVVNSCILFPYQLDGAHIVTVEGLKDHGALNAVQRAMVDNHGSQCGYCTPGFVVAMSGLFETGNGPRACALDEDALRVGLSGNLCRCTGYVQILDAGKAVDPASMPRLCELYPESGLMRALGSDERDVMVRATGDGGEAEVYVPSSAAAAARYKSQHPDVTIAGGTSDLGVLYNKGKIAPRRILCLNNIESFDRVLVEDGRLIMDAGASWGDVEEVVRGVVPEFYQILLRFGSPQIRTAGTVGGNIANASPIADSLPFFFVTETELELTGAKGTRRVEINNFYTGYKKYDLRPDEIISRVITPLPGANQILKLYKVSRRKDLDISTFTAAFLLTMNGGRVERARIAYGGVAPVVLRLPKTEALIEGEELSESLMIEAGEMARSEIAPISDVRGGAEFRLRLAANIPVKFYHEVRQERESVEV